MTSEILDVHERRVRALIDGDLETLDNPQYKDHGRSANG